MDTPPPPPPHGANPKTTAGGNRGGLPDGNYDIFIIPPHSAGGGFIYLPSLKPHTNSFFAGFACALILVAVGSAIMPTMQLWWNGIKSSGGAGMFMVSIGLAIGAWVLGRYQNETGANNNNTSGSGNGRGDAGGAPPNGAPPHGGNGYTSGSNGAPPPNSGPPPHQGHGYSNSHGSNSGGYGGYNAGPQPPPKNSWQQRSDVPPQGAYANANAPPNAGPSSSSSSNTGPKPSSSSYNSGPKPTSNSNANSGARPSSNANPDPPPPPKPSHQRKESGWERAREETKKREEERRQTEELRKAKEEAERKLREAKEEAERKLREQREKEAKERAAREAARERIAREAREARAAREAREAKEKKEKAEREAREQREKAEREAREKREREEREAREKREKAERELRDQREREEAAKKVAEVLAQAKAAEEKRKQEAWAKAKVAAQARQAELDARKKAQEEAERKAAQLAMGRERPVGGSSYAFSATGEKTNPWPQGYPTAAASSSAETSPQRPAPKAYPKAPASASAGSSPQPPRAVPGAASAAAAARAKAQSTAQSTTSTATPTPRASPTKKAPEPRASPTKRSGEESEYSYRPYDTPRYKKSASSIYSDSTYAPSQSTARSTPPPSSRGAYSTKDPDKIILKAAYEYSNAFQKVPQKQLLPFTGGCTDGLILRITSEGLFIDDDVRQIPQRDWDIRSWTLKLVEVWCPSFSSGFRTVLQATKEEKEKMQHKLFGYRHSRVDKIADIGLPGELSDVLIAEFDEGCRKGCRLGRSGGSPMKGMANLGVAEQAGATAGKQLPKLHILRATLKDAEGRKYVFVVGEEEGWKIPLGLKRLRKNDIMKVNMGGISVVDCTTSLRTLGWL